MTLMPTNSLSEPSPPPHPSKVPMGRRQHRRQASKTKFVLVLTTYLHATEPCHAVGTVMCAEMRGMFGAGRNLAPCRHSCRVPPTAAHQEGGIAQHWADRLKEVEDVEKMIPTATTTVPVGCAASVDMLPAGLQPQSATVLQDSISASDRVEETALPRDPPHFGKHKLPRRTHVDEGDLPCAGGSWPCCALHPPPLCRRGLPPTRRPPRPPAFCTVLHWPVLHMRAPALP